MGIYWREKVYWKKLKTILTIIKKQALQILSTFKTLAELKISERYFYLVLSTSKDKNLELYLNRHFGY